MEPKSTGVDTAKREQARQRRAKALANPLRMKILGELKRRPMSVKGFERAFPKYSYQQIYGQFRALKNLGYIEIVSTSGRGGERRGADELYYRATELAWFDQLDWAILSRPEQEEGTAETLTNYVARLQDAGAAGTIDKRPDRHVSWTDERFDKRAWDETIEDLKRLVEKIPGRAAEAAVRLNEEGGEEIRVTVGLTCFESPEPPEIEGHLP